jgi:hypothetical protein
VTAEQPSVEALHAKVMEALVRTEEVWGFDEKPAIAALDSLIAVLERAERERDAGNEKHLVLWRRWQDAEARAQKAEAVVEAARNWVQIAENHTTPFAVPEPERLRAALTAYDEPPTEQIPGAGQRGC